MDVNTLLQTLENETPDKITIARLSDYEQGKLHGRIEIIRYIKRIIDEKE